MLVDAGPPPATPTALTAMLVDRRGTSIHLGWTAPADAVGGAVAGYEVRYANAPIDATSFDAATAFDFTTTPAAPGAPDGVTVTGLYVENDYYFAVAAVSAGGARGDFVATTVAVTAHFQIANIQGFAAGDNFGFGIDGQGDLNGDGISDLLVGTAGGGKAYIYFGTSPMFAPTAPSVTFSATASTNFGFGVAQIGDIDGDGIPDIAISDPTTAVKIYIYKGRTAWPTALTEADANYVISTDASYAGSQFGQVMARLGDFDGDGVNDFALGVPGYSSRTGRVVIVKGKATGFGSIALPDAANTIVIDGDPTLVKATFGQAIVGLGHYFGATGTSLIVGSPGSTTSATASMGHVYAFRGQTGSAGAIALGAADQVMAGPAAGALIGTDLFNLGPVVGTLPNVGVGNPLDTVDFPGVTGCAFVMSGGPGLGPLTNKVIVSQAATSYLVGPVILGGGLSGSDVVLSLVGDAKPDVLLVSEQVGVISIGDGSKFPAPPASLNIKAQGQVLLPLPVGWSIGPNGGSLIPDINGDHVPDFALRGIGSGAPGQVAVYY
jgi:hypothetical protein